MSEHECAEAVAQLYPYLDGELDSEMIATVEAHLRHCTPCLEAFDFETELRHVITAHCAEQMPEGTHDKLMAMLDAVARGEVPGTVGPAGDPAVPGADGGLGGPPGMALE
jgi:mycothiol system anti-sigma-R factor